jgi:hypothetical protein
MAMPNEPGGGNNPPWPRPSGTRGYPSPADLMQFIKRTNAINMDTTIDSLVTNASLVGYLGSIHEAHGYRMGMLRSGC